MKKVDTFVVNADRATVYKVFMDPMKLGPCFPGCKEVKQLSPTTYETLVEVKVQFVPIKILGVGELKESIENERIVVEMKGKPVSLAGSFTNTLTANLKTIEPNKTLVEYEMDFEMTGKLASIGELLMKGSKNKQSAEFMKNVQELF
ncbi:CoxG family protein [Bacillus sinesaloumensis]|uniref:CoxG family protein n=1 Tax=Litchfieldia sinesaloumensis TaxID=1926280 RepID=UPI0009888694|nr:SRPBCC domain-containing protein [Bacillus sinesaloumensis]